MNSTISDDTLRLPISLTLLVAGLSLDIADVEACQFNSIKSAITSKFMFYSKRENARLPALVAYYF